MFDAVVLAGGALKEPLSECGDEKNKAFIEVEGKSLLAYILEALEQSSAVERIIVVGPPEELENYKQSGFNITVVPETASMLENLEAAFREGSEDKLYLVATADIPLVRAEDIDTLVKMCEPHDQDLYYPVVEREKCLEKYPEVERTYVRLKDGYMTGGNICLMRSGWFLKNLQSLELFVSYRKKPLKLLRILPPSLILKYFCKRLSVKDLERYLAKLFNLNARALLCSVAEIAVDVDKKSDLALVKKHLAEKKD